LYKYILIIVVVLSLSLVYTITSWWNVDYTVQENHCTVADLVDDPATVESAIQKFGPHKNYLITVDGRVLVRVDGKWLRLHYNKEG